jgi:hypothetical protein
MNPDYVKAIMSVGFAARETANPTIEAAAVQVIASEHFQTVVRLANQLEADGERTLAERLYRLARFY